MRPTSKYLLYGVYALVALVVCLFLRFPSDLMQELLLERLEQANPDVQLTTRAVALTPIIGIKLDAPVLSYGDIPVIRMDFCKLKPRLLSMFRKKKQITIAGMLGKGQLSGRIESLVDTARPQAVVVLNLERTQLDYIEFLNQWPAFMVDGLMDAIIKYDSAKAGGIADINTTISPAKISLETPLLGIEALEFSRINAQMTLTSRMLQIRNCEATGDQVEGKMTGSIVFRQPMENSRLTLSLTLKPQPAFIADHKNDMIGGLLASENAQKRGVVFRISGTIANPRYVIR